MGILPQIIAELNTHIVTETLVFVVDLMTVAVVIAIMVDNFAEEVVAVTDVVRVVIETIGTVYIAHCYHLAMQCCIMTQTQKIQARLTTLSMICQYQQSIHAIYKK